MPLSLSSLPFAFVLSLSPISLLPDLALLLLLPSLRPLLASSLPPSRLSSRRHPLSLSSPVSSSSSPSLRALSLSRSPLRHLSSSLPSLSLSPLISILLSLVSSPSPLSLSSSASVRVYTVFVVLWHLCTAMSCLACGSSCLLSSSGLSSLFFSLLSTLDLHLPSYLVSDLVSRGLVLSLDRVSFSRLGQITGLLILTSPSLSLLALSLRPLLSPLIHLLSLFHSCLSLSSLTVISPLLSRLLYPHLSSSQISLPLVSSHLLSVPVSLHSSSRLGTLSFSLPLSIPYPITRSVTYISSPTSPILHLSTSPGCPDFSAPSVISPAPPLVSTSFPLLPLSLSHHLSLSLLLTSSLSLSSLSWSSSSSSIISVPSCSLTLPSSSSSPSHLRPSLSHISPDRLLLLSSLVFTCISPLISQFSSSCSSSSYI
ncbi:hypothetical protein C7M84_022879 [Penaeus vannamei]|uniref:Uncharacterized protein n=1 Tax=Penaeus vannamei TaxID=6689 RepID=A0A3R7NFS9_PENVA|nr:hypothetical protein C7M84_022879 [Penaeus vannamei]